MSNQIDNDKPLFLRASEPETWEKPDDVSWGDHFLKPGTPLNARQKQLATMHVLGSTNNEIAEKLHYSVSRVSVLLGATKVKNEIERIRDRMHEEDLEKRMKHLGPDALNVIEELLNDPTVEAAKKESAAKWLLEKLTGKASQQIDVKGEITVGHFLDKLDQMKVVGPAKPEHTKVTGQTTTEVIETTADPMSEWITKNL